MVFPYHTNILFPIYVFHCCERHFITLIDAIHKLLPGNITLQDVSSNKKVIKQVYHIMGLMLMIITLLDLTSNEKIII